MLRSVRLTRPRRGHRVCPGNQLRDIFNQLENIDVQADASLVPEVFTPSTSLQLRLLERGGGYKNIFGWYNLGDDVTDPLNRHIVFQCGDGAGSRKTLNFCQLRANGTWKGGPIGFFIVTPELKTGGTSPNSCAPNSNRNYAYYTEPRLSDDDDQNPHIHHWFSSASSKTPFILALKICFAVETMILKTFCSR